MPKLSVCIITRNEAHRIGPCLESVAFADEIVALDSGSSDDTVAVLEAAGVRVRHQEWLGYGPQKQAAVEEAGHDWVLCIDADERVSPELAGSIQEALAGDEGPHGFEFPRCNRFLGRFLRHGEGYPDLSLRLFDRRHGRWGDEPVHEKVHLEGAPGRLSGDLVHESQESIESYLGKQNLYTTLQAQALFERGKRVGPMRLVSAPIVRFVKFYVLRLGVLDGLPGLVHILIGCFNSFSKYAKLLELQRSRG